MASPAKLFALSSFPARPPHIHESAVVVGAALLALEIVFFFVNRLVWYAHSIDSPGLRNSGLPLRGMNASFVPLSDIKCTQEQSFIIAGADSRPRARALPSKSEWAFRRDADKSEADLAR